MITKVKLLFWLSHLFSKKDTKEEVEMSGTTLCVVDMQPAYPASLEIMKEVTREIELAKRRGDGIVFLELNPGTNGETHQELRDAAHAGEYSKIAYASKVSGDGSHEFVDAAGAAEWFSLKRVRVCGVNRGACVMDTVRGRVGLISKKVKLELAFEATAPGQKTWDGYREDHWEKKSYQHWIDEGILTLR